MPTAQSPNARRYLIPLIPFLFTLPAAGVAVRVMVSWSTDGHYDCSPYHPLWSGPAYLWAVGLGVLGLVTGAVFCWTRETPLALKILAPGCALPMLAWSGWFFPHWFRFDWCI